MHAYSASRDMNDSKEKIGIFGLTFEMVSIQHMISGKAVIACGAGAGLYMPRRIPRQKKNKNRPRNSGSLRSIGT